MSHPTLVAVRLTRKAASVAIFNRTHLEYARLRHLPTSTAKAREALQAFLSWATAQFNVEMFAVEKSDRIDAARVQELTRAVEEHASRAAIPVWHAGKMQIGNRTVQCRDVCRREIGSHRCRSSPRADTCG